MEYVYAALLLHKLKQSVTEDNVKNVITATGTAPDDVKVKALVGALSEINIDEALKAAPLTTVASSLLPLIRRQLAPELHQRRKRRRKRRRRKRH